MRLLQKVAIFGRFSLKSKVCHLGVTSKTRFSLIPLRSLSRNGFIYWRRIAWFWIKWRISTATSHTRLRFSCPQKPQSKNPFLNSQNFLGISQYFSFSAFAVCGNKKRNNLCSGRTLTLQNYTKVWCIGFLIRK